MKGISLMLEGLIQCKTDLETLMLQVSHTNATHVDKDNDVKTFAVKEKWEFEK